jgi:hypothetical protein
MNGVYFDGGNSRESVSLFFFLVTKQSQKNFI